MNIGPTKHSKGGTIQWHRYATGETAILIVNPATHEPELKATVALWPPSPMAGDDEVWIKDWSENEGVAKALVDAGVVTLTDVREPTGHVEAILAKLTPAAITERNQKNPRRRT